LEGDTTGIATEGCWKYKGGKKDGGRTEAFVSQTKSNSSRQRGKRE